MTIFLAQNRPDRLGAHFTCYPVETEIKRLWCELSIHIHHEWSFNSTALYVCTACTEAAVPSLYLSLTSHKHKLEMTQRASSLVHHHESGRYMKMLQRRWENCNPVLYFQTLTFDFTAMPYVVFSLNFKRMLSILLQGLGYDLDDRAIKSFTCRNTEFSILYGSQTDSGVYPLSCSVGSKDLIPRK
jgi:hypothetical protein